MKKMITFFVALLLAASMFSGCATLDGASETLYQQVTAEEARQIMDSEESYIILDVRTQEEFDESHIPGATLLPLDSIESMAESVLPDKDQLILVYCRSGNRSKQASELLTNLGYSRIVEFGGIKSWPYEIEK